MRQRIAKSFQARRRLLSCLAVMTAGMLPVPRAMAGFSYDLRFASTDAGYLDPKNLSLSAAGGATTFTLELWGRVTGTDTVPTNDGLVFGNVSIQSNQVNNGAIHGSASYTTGVTGVALSSNFADSSLSHVGSANSLSADNIQDWGSNTEWWGFGLPPAGLITWFVDRSNPAFINSAGAPRIKGVSSLATDPNTTEWKLATISVSVPAASVSGTLTGITQFLPALANFPAGGGGASQVVTYIQDDPHIDDFYYDAGGHKLTYTSQNVFIPSPSAIGTPLNFIGTAQWATNGNGDWGTAANWIGPVPSTSSLPANFLSALTVPAGRVNLTANQTASSLTFNNSVGSYTIASTTGNSLNITGAVSVLAGSHHVQVPLTAASASISSGASLSVQSLALTSLVVNGTLTTTNLAGGGGNIVLGTVDASGNTVVPGSLTLGSTGLIDLTDRMLIVHYTQNSLTPSLRDGPAEMIKAALVQGRNVAPGGVFDGPWTGTAGITSSRAASDFSAAHIATGSPNTEFYALGYGDTGKKTLSDNTIANKMLINDAGPTFFDPTANGGRGAGIGSTVFVRYTRVGDATMDGIVGNNDVTVLGLNFDPTYNPATNPDGPKHWYDGDFNYNGIVDNNDVTILGLQFDPTNTTGVLFSSLVSQYGSSFAAAFSQGVDMARPSASVVPEPGALALLGVGVLALIRRRRV